MKVTLIGFFMIMGPFAIIALIYFLAKNNIFFTFVKEGSTKAILKFGEFHRLVMSYQEYWFDDNWNIISAA